MWSILDFCWFLFWLSNSRFFLVGMGRRECFGGLWLVVFLLVGGVWGLGFLDVRVCGWMFVGGVRGSVCFI